MMSSVPSHAMHEALSIPRWYAIYTYSRHEKKVAAQLVEKNAVCFLPVRRVANRWKDRMKMVELPLFPGYVFVNLALTERLKVLTTEGVVYMVGFNNQPYPIPDEQIHSIITFMEEKLQFDPYPYLTNGRRVEIKHGPLKGLCGILVRKKSKYKFVVSVDLIQKSVALEIDASDVETV